jgi:SagB-type dehydrogenase family enzyme
MTIQSLQYHRQTSYERHTLGGHYLDWTNQPSVYKSFPETKTIPLSENPPLPDLYLSNLLKNRDVAPNVDFIEDKDLSQIFRLTCSLTAKAATASGPFYYLSVASAGALYPTELYLAAFELQGISNGLYHYSIAHQGLTLLREGNYHSFLDKSANWPEGFHPGLTFFFTVIFFRSSWKYRDRAFRYHLLDTGHLVENLLLALRAKGLPCVLTYDFDDPTVNHFLGLDSSRETVLALVALPDPSWKKEITTAPFPDLDDAIKRASRVAQKEEPYPIIQSIVEAGWEKEAGKNPIAPLSQKVDLPVRQWTSLNPVESWPEKMNYPAAVLTRRSKRNFIKQPLSALVFQAILEGLTVEPAGTRDLPEGSSDSLTLGLLIGQVEGFSPGFYLLDRKSFRLGLIREGSFITPMAQICLDQMWLAQAGFHLLFMSDLAALDHHQGPRGYRYAQMSAGRIGERLYLLASALSLGCCGIGAFYDQEAAELLGLDENSRLIYLVAVGVVKK